MSEPRVCKRWNCCGDLRYVTEWKEPGTGKRTYRSFPFSLKGRRQAEQLRDEILNSLFSGRYLTPSKQRNPSLGEGGFFRTTVTLIYDNGDRKTVHVYATTRGEMLRRQARVKARFLRGESVESLRRYGLRGKKKVAGIREKAVR